MAVKKFSPEDVEQVELLLNKYGCGIWLYNQETAELEYTATQGGRKNPLGGLSVMTLAEGLRLVFSLIKSRRKIFDKDIEKTLRLLGEYRMTWEMWVLSGGDIQDEWSKMYPDAPDLTEDQMDAVAMRFRKGFEATQDNWADTLREAIEDEIESPYILKCYVDGGEYVTSDGEFCLVKPGVDDSKPYVYSCEVQSTLTRHHSHHYLLSEDRKTVTLVKASFEVSVKDVGAPIHATLNESDYKGVLERIEQYDIYDS